MIVLNSTLRKDAAMCREDAFFRYFPITDETMSWGIYVTGAGCAVVNPGEKYPVAGQPPLYQFDWMRGRTLPEFQLIYISEGAGEFESEATGNVKLDRDTVILVFPGVWHRFRPAAATGWTERWFTFNGSSLHRLLGAGTLGPKSAVLLPRDPDQLAENLDAMLDQVRGPGKVQPAMLAFQSLRVISDLVVQRAEDAVCESSIQTGVRRDDPVVQRALEIIWTHSPCPMSVSDIARQLPVTRRTLDRRFMDVMGHSVLEEINACRLSRAKRLLTETDLPVKAVAHRAGFNSTERMRVVFVEREGISPTDYRKQSAAGQRVERKSPGKTNGSDDVRVSELS